MHSVKCRTSCGFTKFVSSFCEIIVTSRIFLTKVQVLRDVQGTLSVEDKSIYNGK